jgi:hypothetical protein
LTRYGHLLLLNLSLGSCYHPLIFEAVGEAERRVEGESAITERATGERGRSSRGRGVGQYTAGP